MREARKAQEKTFKIQESYKPDDESVENLIKAIAILQDKNEVCNFLRDIMTIAEIEELAMRLDIAKNLFEKKHSYKEIAEKVKTSTTTVTRVSHWLFRGCGGYANVLKKMLEKNE